MNKRVEELAAALVRITELEEDIEAGIVRGLAATGHLAEAQRLREGLIYIRDRQAPKPTTEYGEGMTDGINSMRDNARLILEGWRPR